MMKKIDVHCHIFPVEYVNELEKRNLFNVRTRPPIWVSAEARIADMDNMGIERQVLSLAMPIVYFNDDALNLYFSRMVNDLIADICHKFPSRFSGFASVPLNNVKDTIDELQRATKAPGMLGVVLGAHARGKALASEEFLPFFEEANRKGTTIFLHPVEPVDIQKVKEYQDFYRSMGYLWETTMAVGRMALNGIFQKFPKVNWILSHLGGTIPFVYTSFDICQQRNPAKEYMPPKPVSEYLRRLYVDTARHLTIPILNCAMDLYGESNILFGSDIPFAYDVARLNISNLEEFKLPEAIKENLCFENAKKLLRL